MNKKEAIEVMQQAFDSLDKSEKANLRYHARKKTPIYCGRPRAADRFISKEGFAWPAILASTREVDFEKDVDGWPKDTELDYAANYCVSRMMKNANAKYLDALTKLDQEEIRNLMRKL